ncbi:MAG: YceI family protein [Chloroflexi bacterium]|nr:MAG: YceI family protein [Chloroflexota bacterium]
MSWEIDATHSQATFSVKHMMISTVRGHFEVLSGKLHIDEEHPDNSWVEAEVDAASINTRDAKRDGHLRSPDFFDVEKYPKITFKSTKITPTGNNEYRVTGDLTMHGVTKEETFHADYSGQVKDLYGLQRAAFTVKGKINRKDFGLNWNVGLEAGGVLVGEDVNIEIDLAAVQKAAVQEAATQTA